MQQALTTPLFQSVLLGLSLLGAGAAYSALHEEPTVHRLVLHVPPPAHPNTVYVSAWHQGDVMLSLDAGPLPAITFETRASVSDGCRWLGTEHLVPIDSKTYAYDYSEIILECDPGSTPATKTPRTGYVTVE